MVDNRIRQVVNYFEKNRNSLSEFRNTKRFFQYSEPSIETALDTLLSKEIEELNVIPMYPQYSGTTVGSVFDSVMNYFIKSDRIVDIKFIRSFYNNPQYIGYFSK